MIEQIKAVLIALKILGIEKRIDALENRPSSGNRHSSPSGIAQTDADLRYVKKGGEVLTGDYEFPATGFIMQSSGGNRAYITMDDAYHLVPNPISVATPSTGNPLGVGWFMFVTYP